MFFREINVNDYYKGYFELLKQLTECNISSYQEFKDYLNNHISDRYKIFVYEHDNKILASGTILLENKIIHNFGIVGHIEDIVVDKSLRGKGIGKQLIEFLISYAKDKQAYKIILDCSEHNVEFYKKCDLLIKGIQMARYF